MNLLKKSKILAHQIFLKKKLRNFHPERKFLNIDDAKEIGVLFDATEESQREIVNRFVKKLKKENKAVELLGFIRQPKMAVNIDFPFFTKKNLNWFYRPEGENISYFIRKPFDILINAHTHNNSSLEYIAALSHAKFRVGRYIDSKKFCFDFMINTNGSDDLNDFIHQVNHYLKIINPNEKV